MDKIVSLNDASFTYRNTHLTALNNIILGITSGEFVVIMGANGAGKSSFCYTLNGLIPHFIKGELKGQVVVDGKDTRQFKVKDFAPIVGFVFQDFEAQLFSTKVELEVAFGCENLCLAPSEIRQRIKNVLQFTHLENLQDRSPYSLSGGQKQRLAIAAVLAMEPKILVLDEPTTDLDPIGKAELFSLGYNLRDSRQKTIVMVEHETEEVLKADRIIIMQDGKIKASGSTQQILSQIDLLRDSGIMPIQVAELFYRLGKKELPFTVEEALQEFKKNKWQINTSKYNQVIEKDKILKHRYGRPIIQVKNLSYEYPGGITALQNINLTVKEGEFLAILGQNGSGKTTLIKHFNGLLTPTSGEVLVDGKDTRSETIQKLARTVGYVFQNPDHQIFAETVYEDVAFGPKLYGLDTEEVKIHVTEALQAVGLNGFEDRDPFILTKGQRQKIAVASVLATKPKVIILDEPTTGLDYKELRSMMTLLEKLNRTGHTIIIVTHSMWVAAEYAQRVVVLKEGQIYLEGTPREVFSEEEKLAQTFLKSPSIISLSHRLGKTMLSVDEFTDCL